MAPFHKPTASRKPQARRESGDFAPQLPLRRGSRNINIWATDAEDDQDTSGDQSSGLLQRNSNDTFRQFLEEEEDGITATGGTKKSSKDRDYVNSSAEDIIDQRQVCKQPKRLSVALP